MRPATFRGVQFFIDSSELDGGRRGVTHEYPFRDDPFREDLGRKARSFSVDGYVLGDDYFTQRNSMLAALEKEGPGELQHPYWGTRRVAVLEFKIKETKKDGGSAAFSINFEETPSIPTQPSTTVDGTGLLAASSAAASVAVGAEFLAKYNPGLLLSSVSASMASALAKINSISGAVGMTAQAIAGFKQKLVAFQDGVETLLNSPATLLASVEDLFQTLADAADPLTSPGVALRAVYSYDPGLRPPATTTNRAQEQLNFDAVQLLIQRAALVQMANLAVAGVYDSYEAALAERDAIADLIDDQMDAAVDDTYPALQQLRADLAKAVPGDNSDLPRVLSYTPVANVPSLVLAQRLYGTVDSELSMVARNGLRYPGFVAGGLVLEVLSDE